MRTPQENATGYEEGAPLKYVQGLTARYLLVHGTGDDNVHPQNSIQLVDKLEAAEQAVLSSWCIRTARTRSRAATRARISSRCSRILVEQNAAAPAHSA